MSPSVYVSLSPTPSFPISFPLSLCPSPLCTQELVYPRLALGLQIVAETDFEFLILLPSPPMFWDYKCERLHIRYAMNMFSELELRVTISHRLTCDLEETIF